MKIRKLAVVALATTLTAGVLTGTAPATASTGRQATSAAGAATNAALPPIMWRPYQYYDYDEVVLSSLYIRYRCLLPHYALPEWDPDTTPALWQRISLTP
ncbi:hypothetical protein [Streptosporangium carneum]|uniref:Chitin-binding type-3 domain-containing protein n=1 Tax=Streptosporangium carneum TaxID=47481 RepID=A0A9W6IBN9_9ACTN|nr:hypothetical protein [Streptosporangium carneum]GLK14744.1 hypothetical protein GCM10017600_81560 [Streptosporangium carneum]